MSDMQHAAMSVAADEHILSYIQKQHVLSLAAHDHEQVWAASLFYAADLSVVNSPALIILTAPSTLHGQLMVTNPHIAGTIAGQPEVISDICGLQFKGDVHLLTTQAAEQAKSLYFNRFPQAKGMDAAVWQITLKHLKLTDNSLGFGKKLIWSAHQ